MFHIKHIVSWGYAASPPVILVIKGAHSNAFLSEYFSSAESSIPQTQQNTNEWRAPVGHGCQEVARILRTLLTLFQINKVMNFISHSDTLSTSCGRQVKGESPLLPASPAHPMFFYCGSQMGFSEDACHRCPFSHQTCAHKIQANDGKHIWTNEKIAWINKCLYYWEM